MTSISLSLRHAYIVAVIFALAACGGSQNQPSGAGLMLPQADRVAVGPATKQFGVGLGDAAGLSGDVSGYSHEWCNGAPGNPSGCYGEVPGKRKFVDSASGRIELVNGSNQSDGYAEVKLDVSSKLGVGSYTLSGEVSEKIKFLKNVGAAAEIVASDWDDMLHVHSKTLKNGTPVAIGVQLALTPSTDVACDAAQNSFGELDVYSASVTPPSGSQFAIGGYCVNGSFEYYLYGNTKQMGTTAKGTINTSVGASYPIYFATSGQVIACQSKNYCVGDIVASLSGKYKFTITSITKGATYTTASGNMYQ